MVVTLFKPSITHSSAANNNVKNNGLISITATNPPTEDTDTMTYTYYNGPGNCYEYQITLKAFANVYNYNGNSPRTDGFGMCVVNQKYFYNGTQQPNYNFLYVFNTIGTEVLTSPSSTTNKDVITIADWGIRYTKKVGGLTISNPTLTIGKLVNLSVSWSPTTTVVTDSGPKTFSYSNKICGIKVPFVYALNAADDQCSLIMTKDLVSLSTQDKLSRAVFAYDMGFNVNNTSKLGSGQLTAACHYR